MDTTFEFIATTRVFRSDDGFQYEIKFTAPADATSYNAPVALRSWYAAFLAMQKRLDAIVTEKARAQTRR